jgi:hypothetical protein
VTLIDDKDIEGEVLCDSDSVNVGVIVVLGVELNDNVGVTVGVGDMVKVDAERLSVSDGERDEDSDIVPVREMLDDSV